MEILFWHPSFNAREWSELLAHALPQARVRVWQPGDDAHADYALVWQPPVEMLQGRKLKGVFVLGAGVDAILERLRTHPTMLREDVPLFRLEDTGMAQQMQEYAVSQVLRWFRRFDDYQLLQAQAQWQPLEEYARETFTIGILGAGVLGAKVAESLQAWDFPVRCWSRSVKNYPGVVSFAGNEQLATFLNGCRVLINLLPSTPDTAGIINAKLLSHLPQGAYVLNVARGAHVVVDDLLAALDCGKLSRATLDVFSAEPLAPDSPLWAHPRVAITPHIGAVTRPAQAVEWIAAAIGKLEQGVQPGGLVDRQRGY